MVTAAPSPWHNMVYLEYLEWEVHLAAVADALLLSKEHVLVLPVVLRRVNVRAARDICARGDEAVTPVGWAGGWASWADAGDIRMNKRQAAAGKARTALMGFSIQQIPLPRRRKPPCAPSHPPSLSRRMTAVDTSSTRSAIPVVPTVTTTKRRVDETRDYLLPIRLPFLTHYLVAPPRESSGISAMRPRLHLGPTARPTPGDGSNGRLLRSSGLLPRPNAQASSAF